MILFSRKGRQHGLRRRTCPCLPLALTLICLGLLGYSAAAAQDIFSVTKEGRITAHIADLPLGQALAALSQNVPLEIRGSVAEDERLTLHFSQLTLQEVLQEMMVSYNYVLIRPEAQGKPILVVLGKAEKGAATVPLPTTGLPSSQPMMPPPLFGTLQPSPSMPPPPSYGLAPPSSDGIAPVPSSPATASVSPLLPAPPMPPPLSAGPANESQVATGQGNLPPDSNVGGSADVAPNFDSQPAFNPAAWGGRGFRGTAASGKK